jgi:hypothetical protein
MSAVRIFLIIYLIIGGIYASYNNLKEMDSLKKIPLNILLGPPFVIYIIWITLTKRRPRIG